MLEVDFLGISAKRLNRSFPQREGKHSFWNIHTPSRRCLASLSLPELLWRRWRADPENWKVRTMSKEHFEWQHIKAGQDSPANHLEKLKRKEWTDKTVNSGWDYGTGFSEMGHKHLTGEYFHRLDDVPALLWTEQLLWYPGECGREYLFQGNAGPTDSQGCSWWLISWFFMVHCQMEQMDRAEEAPVFLNWS